MMRLVVKDEESDEVVVDKEHIGDGPINIMLPSKYHEYSFKFESFGPTAETPQICINFRS